MYFFFLCLYLLQPATTSSKYLTLFPITDLAYKNKFHTIHKFHTREISFSLIYAKPQWQSSIRVAPLQLSS